MGDNVKAKFIGFPIKDGCHVDGSDEGIKVLEEKTNFDKIIDIEHKSTDIETVVVNDTVLAKTVDEYQANGFIPVTVGGDHALAIGSISGSSKNNPNLGVLWIDTHPDSNTNDVI